MNSLTRNRRLNFGVTVCVSYVLVLAVLMSGCESLRRKFTRKKKEGQEVTEVPVLEPIEYPAKIYTPQDVYKKHYTLWKAWYKELLENLSPETGQKRQLYLLNQIVANLKEIQKLLPEEKQGELKSSLDRLKKFESDIREPVPVRSLSSWKTELESIEKAIKKEYTFSKVQNNLKPESAP